MLFNSALFLFFFPCAAALLYATPTWLRWVTLLLASMLWQFLALGRYRDILVIIFAIAAVAYVYGHACQHLANGAARWALAGFTPCTDLAAARFFVKYAQFHSQ